MPVFNYNAIDQEGQRKKGQVEAVNVEVAINSLQKRGLTISSINSDEEKKKGLLTEVRFFERVSNKDVVVLSRQISTLFGASVSALRIFRLIAEETENRALRDILNEVADDLQGGSSISEALSKHPKVFSEFYINMVRSGEESGKLDEVFEYLADYLDRTYEVTSKAKSALIYPLFVVATFILVMILMMVVVIPKITAIITEAGQEIPIYTKIVIATSNFLVNNGIWMAILLVIAGFVVGRYIQKTDEGKVMWSEFKLSIPYLGNLYRKLYLSRIADNMHTMVLSGIPMVQALEVTANVVGDRVYKEIMLEVLEAVRGGSSVSKALDGYEQIPGIMVQMVKVGEETGEIGKIMETLASFYRREVQLAIDTLVDLIEPILIVGLGIGVGVLLAAVILPIYSLSGAF